VNPRNRRKPRRGRLYRLDLRAFKRMGSVVEGFFAWLGGGFRRSALGGEAGIKVSRLLTASMHQDIPNKDFLCS
jgi:hypothetical protein